MGILQMIDLNGLPWSLLFRVGNAPKPGCHTEAATASSDDGIYLWTSYGRVDSDVMCMMVQWRCGDA